MSPPQYSDLGKCARDLFNNGYHFGLMKLNCKSKTANGVEFTSGGTAAHDTGKVNGSLESKYKVKEYGLTFVEKWNTNNVLSTEVTVQDQLVKGLKVSFDSSFAPQTSEKSGRIRSSYSNANCAINCDVDLLMGGPQVLASTVIGYNGWLAGYQTKFDAQNTKITMNNIALGYDAGDFTFHTNVNDGQEFGGSVYQKVKKNLDAGVQLAWKMGSNDTRFGIACKYQLDSEASVRAKINNNSQIGLGYQQKLRPGVTLTLSTLIDGKNFNQGGHKIGLALELEA